MTLVIFAWGVKTGHCPSFPIFLLIYKLTSSLAAIKFYRMAMQIVPDIEFKINYSHPADADRGGGN